MCGITGLIHCGSKDILSRMTSLVSYRGPDDGGTVWFDEHGSGLGHRRLSIIDLSALGHQPYTNPQENVWLVFNGEIFNFAKIKSELVQKGYSFRSHSDTEVILYSYLEWGERCVEKFNGMFALAIFDKRDNSVFIARDHLGIKPLYYAEFKGGLIFASEIKSILEFPNFPAEADRTSLLNPTRYYISPLTGFKNISKLKPGHYMKFAHGRLSHHTYWDVSPAERERPVKEALEELDFLLNDSLDLQMVADVPVGVLLSGGLDSSLIAALMRKRSNSTISAFTIGFSGEDQKFERMTDDRSYARKVARSLDLDHHEIELSPDVISLLPKMIWHMDEPISDPASINTYLISKFARENNIIVLLSGMGGDEIFGGYRKHLACLIANYYRFFVPSFMSRALGGAVSRLPVASSTSGFKYIRWLKRFMKFASLNEFERFLAADLTLDATEFGELFANHGVAYNDAYFVKAERPYFEDKELSYVTKMCYSDTKVFLPEHNLTYSDKSSMAASIEMRPPLIDRRIVEFMFSLPPEYRIRNFTQKWLLKKAAERYLSKEIIYRPKAPFSAPLRSWVKNDLSEMIEDVLNEKAVRERGLFSYPFVRKAIDENKNGIEDHSLLIWTLLTVELWHKIFIDKTLTP